jgi:hypothetical protein
MSIQDFPLAWRWTQASHSVLPPEVLEDIRPLSAAEAAGVGTSAPSRRKSAVSHADGRMLAVCTRGRCSPYTALPDDIIPLELDVGDIGVESCHLDN